MVITKVVHGQCSKDFKSGTKVTLVATPCPGSKFVRWEGACTGTQKTCTVTIDSNKTVTAVWKKIPIPKNLRISEKQMQMCKNYNEGFISQAEEIN